MSSRPNLSATVIKEEPVSVKKPVNLLPRSVLRSNAYILLDGEWNFSPDPQNEGVNKGWHLGHQYPHTAQWPGSVEQHLAQVKGQAIGRTWEDKIVVWYERTFPLPHREDDEHQIFQLTFGA